MNFGLVKYGFEIYEKRGATLIQFPALASLNCLWYVTLRLRDLGTATNPVCDTEKKSCKSSSQGVVVTGSNRVKRI
jgi:hypothetical protein